MPYLPVPDDATKGGENLSALVALRPFTGPLGPLTVIEARRATARQSDVQSLPLFLTAEIGEKLGYTENGFLKTCFNWREAGELREGEHYQTWTGDALAPLKSANLVGARAGALTLLTERGLWRVLILTGKPAGIRLRDWLDSEVLPEIARTGGYATPAGKAEIAARKLALSESRERRAIASQFVALAKAAKGTPAAQVAIREAMRVHGVELPMPQPIAETPARLDPVLAAWSAAFGDAPITVAEAWTDANVREAATAARIASPFALGIALRGRSAVLHTIVAVGRSRHHAALWRIRPAGVVGEA
jgi:prophage antirepressor-like protein